MAKKIEKSSVYTTIQIRKDINKLIRQLCKQRGLQASTITENFWISLISSSMSGSISI